MKELVIFVLTVVILYYGVTLFIRYGLPWIIMHYFEKQQDKFRQGMNDEQNAQKTEGEIKVKSSQKKNGKADDKNFGEYIDFEEIDENE